jgi:hypothetical protein
MSYAICLDQNTPNFNINNLSPYGFAIYSNFDNYQTPLAQGINYTQLFPFPIGNCPFILTNLPAGATQIIVIDQCDPNLDVAAAIFSPTNITAGELTIECCYAIIDIPQGPPPIFCEACPLIFDEFPTSTIGSIVAGNLTSTCGPVTDYVIGWYLNGNYSSPVLTSGYGTLFTPYQFTHPLTGNNSVPVFSGNWEGIVHDIAINGVTYSSVSGSAGGQLIPFESCFDTIVVDPLQCDNGSFQGIAKYTHQINFNSQAVGTTSTPVSLTYALDTTTNYFAYFFQAYSVWDEIEIKWKSGNPSVTTNPSLYSQPIYLEKLKRGSDLPPPPNSQNFLTTPYLPISPNQPFNNVWPKLSSTFYADSTPYQGFQRVLTLTNLETSSNPLSPDLLEITITPNPTNNNTQWKAAFQCLDNFDCTDCNFDNWPNSLPKINSLYLTKIYGCEAQRLELNITGCMAQSDFVSFTGNPLTSLSGSLVGSNVGTAGLNTMSFPANPQYLPLTPTSNCGYNLPNNPACGPSSTGTITLNKTPQQIQLTFNLYSDYLYYKNSLDTSFNTIQPSPPTSPVLCSAGSTNLDYYNYTNLVVPVQQSATANCGDNTTFYNFFFHINDYFNIVYVNNNNPLATSWSITIPQTQMVNCYPNNLSCSNCYSIINNFINFYNLNVQNQSIITFTTTVGAKAAIPFQSNISAYPSASPPTPSGSFCPNQQTKYTYFPWYSTATIPFIPSPSSPTGWINLPSLSGSIPCNFNPYQSSTWFYDTGWMYQGYIEGFRIRYPHLTSSFNYSLSTNDFEIYSVTNLTNTGSLNINLNQYPIPCPDPSGSLIYSYIGGVPTVYSASYFVGGSPTLTIDP